MNGELLAEAEDETCPGCGTPIKRGITTQYLESLDAEICAVCEQPLSIIR